MKKINVFTFILFLNFTFSIAQEGIVYYSYTDAIGVGGNEGEIYNAYTIFSKDKSSASISSIKQTIKQTAKPF